MTPPALRDDPLARTLPGRLAWWAGHSPERTAIREKRLGIWRPVTWAAYHANVRAIASALWKVGCRPGDHVTILSDNRPQWLYADLGAQAIGARAVGIYQTNPPADVAYVLTHCRSKILFCEDQEQVDKVMEVRSETPDLEHVVVIDPRGTRGYHDPRLRRWDEFLQTGRDLDAADPDWFGRQLADRDPGAPSMVVYTSGTTGPPKGAMISSANALAAADVVVPLFGLTEKDLVLSYLPLCHVAEKIFSEFIPLTCGGIVHFGEAIETVQADLREVSPTVFLGVPRIWEKMHAAVTLRMRDSSRLKRLLFDFWTRRGEKIARRRLGGRRGVLDRLQMFAADQLVFRPLRERLGLGRCRYPISGAAPISPELLWWFHGAGIPILEGYGMTEDAGASHINPPDAPRLGSVGKALSGVECRIAEDGEILVRGGIVFAGYLHDAEATRNTVDEDGWLHTGDVGEVDDDGYLRITGRKKEIIITSGGKNLSPEKIENALKASPYIKEAVAIGDGRKFVSALVQIDYDAVGHWAARRKMAYTSYADLAAKPEVHKLVGEEVKRANEHLARVEAVRAFRILPKELHQDDGELTATQKVRRREVYRRHRDLIESMYGGDRVAAIGPQRD